MHFPSINRKKKEEKITVPIDKKGLPYIIKPISPEIFQASEDLMRQKKGKEAIELILKNAYGLTSEQMGTMKTSDIFELYNKALQQIQFLAY